MKDPRFPESYACRFSFYVGIVKHTRDLRNNAKITSTSCSMKELMCPPKMLNFTSKGTKLQRAIKLAVPDSSEIN